MASELSLQGLDPGRRGYSSIIPYGCQGVGPPGSAPSVLRQLTGLDCSGRDQSSRQGAGCCLSHQRAMSMRRANQTPGNPCAYCKNSATAVERAGCRQSDTVSPRTAGIHRDLKASLLQPSHIRSHAIGEMIQANKHLGLWCRHAPLFCPAPSNGIESEVSALSAYFHSRRNCSSRATVLLSASRPSSAVPLLGSPV